MHAVHVHTDMCDKFNFSVCLYDDDISDSSKQSLKIELTVEVHSYKKSYSSEEPNTSQSL